MIPDWILQIALIFFSLLGGSVIWYYISKASYHHVLWYCWLAIVLLVTVVALYVRNTLIGKENEARRPVYAGFLIAAREAGPTLPEDVPKETVQLLLGDDLRVLAAHSENHILSLRGKPFLTIGIKDDVMTIKTTLVDSQNRYIARLLDNEFQASHESTFNPRQPDKHSLLVRDADGNEVLNVRFMNKTTIRIVGRFHLAGYADPLVILPKEGIRWSGVELGHLTVDLTQGKAGFLNLK